MKIVTMLLTAMSILALCGFVFQQAVVEGGFGPAALVGTVALAGLALLFATLTYLTSTRHRELVAKVMLAFFSATASYLVLDLVAGWILIVPLSPPLVPDAFRRHALLPDSYAEIRQRDFVYLQRVNHLGLRGRETTVEKSAGTRRILMLGDSFTMAKGVQEDETFSVLVEQALQAPMQACGGGRIEVLNAGVDSYSPLLEYLYFKRDLARLDPDLVVLNFDNSDLIQEAAYRRQATRDSSGEITAVPQIWQDSLYERFLSWTNRHLFITRAVLVYITRATDAAMGRHLRFPAPSESPHRSGRNSAPADHLPLGAPGRRHGMGARAFHPDAARRAALEREPGHDSRPLRRDAARGVRAAARLQGVFRHRSLVLRLRSAPERRRSPRHGERSGASHRLAVRASLVSVAGPGSAMRPEPPPVRSGRLRRRHV